MDDPHSDTSAPTNEILRTLTPAMWQCIRFSLEVAVIYLIVKFTTPFLAGWTQRNLILLVRPDFPATSRFEFLFSHLFVFSFAPAFLLGMLNIRFRSQAASYVWLVPAAILTYKLVTYAPPNIFESRWPAALHYYFGGGFSIPEYHSWREFWSVVVPNPDALRGLAQSEYTAPFYAGVAYSLAAWVCLRTSIDKKFVERFNKWEAVRLTRTHEQGLEAPTPLGLSSDGDKDRSSSAASPE